MDSLLKQNFLKMKLTLLFLFGTLLVACSASPAIDNTVMRLKFVKIVYLKYSQSQWICSDSNYTISHLPNACGVLGVFG